MMVNMVKLTYVVKIVFSLAVFMLISTSYADINTLSLGKVPIYHQQESFLPQIEIRYSIEIGSIDAPKSQAGLVNLLAQSLRLGTLKYSEEELNFILDDRAIHLSISLDHERLTIAMKLLKENVFIAADILSELISNATFPEKKVMRLRQEMIGGLKLSQSNPGWVAQQRFSELVYKGTPYQAPISGYPFTLNKIKPSDLRKMYDKVFQRRRRFMVLVGDITTDEIKDVFSLIMSESTNYKKRKPKRYKFNPTEQTVNKYKSIKQSHISFAGKGVTRSADDYYVVQVLNHIVGGGGLDSMLAKEVREKNGLAYSIHSQFVANKNIGFFKISLQTKSDSTSKAIDLVEHVLAQTAAGNIKKSDLKLAKQYLVDSFPLRVETSSQIASYIVYIARHDLPLDYFDYYPDQISDVTLSQVKKAAKNYFTQPMMTFILGPKDAL
jgi:zinc protease